MKFGHKKKWVWVHQGCVFILVLDTDYDLLDTLKDIHLFYYKGRIKKSVKN